MFECSFGFRPVNHYILLVHLPSLYNLTLVLIAGMPKRPRPSETSTMAEAGPSTAAPGAGASAEGATNEEALLKVPQKRFYRQRAHANVFVDHLLD
jgi:hypothetical protein